MGAVPTAWRATAQENAAASKAEREGLGVRFAGALGPGADRTHFGMKWVGRGNVIPIGYGETTRN